MYGFLGFHSFLDELPLLLRHFRVQVNVLLPTLPAIAYLFQHC